MENTSTRDPLLHLGGMLADGQSGYITGMEAAGQAQLVASDLLPTDSPWDELTALGFTRGDVVAGDELFTHATLPAGWTRCATSHDMHSDVLDERGIIRVRVFYKAAFYDRRAHASVARVGADETYAIAYGDGDVALPETWPLFTADERADLIAGARDILARDNTWAVAARERGQDVEPRPTTARASVLIGLAEAAL